MKMFPLLMEMGRMNNERRKLLDHAKKTFVGDYGEFKIKDIKWQKEKFYLIIDWNFKGATGGFTEEGLSTFEDMIDDIATLYGRKATWYRRPFQH
jgi:hypothetical protein